MFPFFEWSVLHCVSLSDRVSVNVCHRVCVRTHGRVFVHGFCVVWHDADVTFTPTLCCLQKCVPV